MLYLTLDLWPGGDPARSETLAVGAIANDGKNPEHPRLGSYSFSFGRSARRGASQEIVSGSLADWDRSQSPLILLRDALNEAYPPEGA